MFVRTQWNKRNLTLPYDPVVTPRPPAKSTGLHIPRKAEESQLSSSRTGSDPPVSLALRQRLPGTARAPSGQFLPVSAGVTRPESVGPRSSRALVAQYSHNSTLLPPQIITDGVAPSVVDLTLESREYVVLLWQPPSCFRSGAERRLSWTTCRVPARSSLWWRRRPVFSRTATPRSLLCPRRPARAQAHWSRRV